MKRKPLITFFALLAMAPSLWGSPQSQATETAKQEATSKVAKATTKSTDTATNSETAASTTTETKSSSDKTTSANTSTASKANTNTTEKAKATSSETAIESQIHEEEETNMVQAPTSSNDEIATATETAEVAANTATTTSTAADTKAATSEVAAAQSATTSKAIQTTTTTTDLAAAAEDILSFDTARISATFGYRIATNLMADPGFNFDLDSFIMGMRQAIDGKQAPMSDDEFMEAISKIQEKALKELSDTNLSEANTFMDENKKNQSVVEITPGKLQYEVLEEGRGTEVTKNSKPAIHFTGKYLDGMVFASSIDNETPIVLPNGEDFSFRSGINGAKEGERRRVYIHPELGFGTKGFHPPNSLLVFDVTVVKANSENSESSPEEISARMGLETITTTALNTTNTTEVDVAR
ncbi:MAG: hypothetical protein GWP59_03695 [Chlamydiales bacterium]|jgi:peptidylprolyl isomerase|nr:FKBP-type peptidyl-prolyl cis-trans isomerase [Chlamydiales bacterium]NCF70788.1 hypothetical protein [Chlamydiales bacterium]